MFAKNKNMIAGIFLFIVSTIYGLLSFSIPLTNIDKLVGSRLMPQVCAVIIMFCSAWLIIDNIIKN
jgi:amino acid permease